ncbi:hypothetical protein ACRALDRAFT_1056479 [Sodiomyces alcalophilus JCM 7366]|uniref:uncharacterized protein n=1 Tax=Sodiomyces alcalophilus JCM 7366 TaxID=591952 RepID=UPI0039B61982
MRPPLSLCIRRSLRRPPTLLRPYNASRSSSSSSNSSNNSPGSEPPTNALGSRWFSDLQSRLRRLAASSLGAAGRKEAERLLQFVQAEWMVFVAGREGFLTEEKWRGVDRSPVAWGNMVRIVW